MDKPLKDWTPTPTDLKNWLEAMHKTAANTDDLDRIMEDERKHFQSAVLHYDHANHPAHHTAWESETKGGTYMMTKLKSEVRTLISRELERANQDNPQFHSPHEGYAVLLEELDEVEVEFNRLKLCVGFLWGRIKHDIPADPVLVRVTAERLACEAIQVAAMAEKFHDLP